MTARSEILARVASGIGKGDFAGRRAAAEAALRDKTLGPQPARPGNLVERFRQRAESLSSTVALVASLAGVPEAVVGYLDQLQLGKQAVISPDLAGLDWSASNLTVAARAAIDADTVGITGCFCAIAETGTLMLVSAPGAPGTVSLLPETHIALVHVADIVATMEQGFARLRDAQSTLPRAVNFVSGPSRTGDIEQTIVLGAHGPCRVHLILIGESV